MTEEEKITKPEIEPIVEDEKIVVEKDGLYKQAESDLSGLINLLEEELN